MEKQYMTLVVEYTPIDGKPVYPSAFLSNELGAKMIGFAKGELREWKKRANAAFDPIWKPGSDVWLMNRSHAYSWLAMKLGIDKSECHIGMFDVDMCKRVVDICGIRILEELGE